MIFLFCILVVVGLEGLDRQQSLRDVAGDLLAELHLHDVLLLRVAGRELFDVFESVGVRSLVLLDNWSSLGVVLDIRYLEHIGHVGVKEIFVVSLNAETSLLDSRFTSNDMIQRGLDVGLVTKISHRVEWPRFEMRADGRLPVRQSGYPLILWDRQLSISLVALFP